MVVSFKQMTGQILEKIQSKEYVSMSDYIKEITKSTDKGMSRQEAYAQLFVDAWRRKHPRKRVKAGYHVKGE